MKSDMHIAIFGVGLAFYPFPPTTVFVDREGHSDGEVGEMHGEGGETDGQVGERNGGRLLVTHSRQQAAFPCGVSG